MSRAIVVALGTELTRGIIKDSNCHVISRELTHLGVHVSSFIAIPDDGTLGKVLETAKDEFDIIVITGGLGPTEDDLTRTLIAESAGVPLVRNEEAFAHLVERLGERANGANEKQAYIPEGFSLIKNGNGTAPGFYGKLSRAMLFVLPGPPREMEPMLYDSVLVQVRRLLDIPEVERDEYASLITAEARLEELCEKVGRNLSWATRFQDFRISLYVSGGSKEERDEAIAALRAEVGRYRILDGDESALTVLSSYMKEHGLTLAVAESCTGGLLSSELTSLAGASEFYKGSVTSYATAVKKAVLGVDEDVVRNFSVVSRECAIQMAEGVGRLLDSSYAVSVTGVAGPQEQDGRKVGTVCLGFYGKGRPSEAVELCFTSWGRESIRRRASVAAMILLYAFARGESAVEVASTWRNI